jgi:hypothetical protein
VITYVEVFPLLVAACPGYEQSSFAAEADEADGVFLRVGHLVRYLIDALDRSEPHELTAVFGVVDCVLEEGDDEARSLITDGFFDDLTNTDFYDGACTRPHDFVPWLGPRAMELPDVRRLSERPRGTDEA